MADNQTWNDISRKELYNVWKYALFEMLAVEENISAVSISSSSSLHNATALILPNIIGDAGGKLSGQLHAEVFCWTRSYIFPAAVSAKLSVQYVFSLYLCACMGVWTHPKQNYSPAAKTVSYVHK